MGSINVSPCYQLLSPDALNFSEKLLNQKTTAATCCNFLFEGICYPLYKGSASFSGDFFSLSICCILTILISSQKTKLLVTVFSAPSQNPEGCSCINSAYIQHLVKKLGFPALWTLSDKFSSVCWVSDF